MNEVTESKREAKNELISVSMLDKASKGHYSGYAIIDNMINTAVRKISRRIKSHFGIEMNISPNLLNPHDKNTLYKWFSEQSPKFKKKYNAITRQSKATNNNGNEYIKNDSFNFQIRGLRNTYIFLKIGQDYRDTMMSSRGAINAIMNDMKFQDTDMHLYIFGKEVFKCAASISEIINGREDNTFRMYNVQGDKSITNDVAFKSLYQDVDKRKMETIFMEPGTIESITDHIDNYLSNKHLYSGRGIIYKTGILMYGEPGTGKTSLLKALASKYDYDLILIDMTTFDNIALDTLTHSLNIDDEKYIIALEDIDCVIADRENENVDKDDKRVINKLLQFLDSNSSPNEVIFIATTNHVELLDEALLREGRFDLKVNIGGIKRDKVIEMCESFNLSKREIDAVLDQVEEMGIDLDTQTIRQSKLQTLILKTSGLSLKAEEEEVEEDADTDNITDATEDMFEVEEGQHGGDNNGLRD